MTATNYIIDSIFVGPLKVLATHDPEAGFLMIQVNEAKLNKDGEIEESHTVQTFNLQVSTPVNEIREQAGWDKYYELQRQIQNIVCDHEVCDHESDD